MVMVELSRVKLVLMLWLRMAMRAVVTAFIRLPRYGTCSDVKYATSWGMGSVERW